MVAYSFQKRFEAPIVADTKLHTIRAPRKRHARFGDELQLYVGMRTKGCRLIARRRALSTHNVVIDVAAETIAVSETFPPCRKGPTFEYEWAGQKVRLAHCLDLDQFAARDGFEDWKDMRAFWVEQHAMRAGALAEIGPFHGVIIRWTPSEANLQRSAVREGIERELEELGL